MGFQGGAGVENPPAVQEMKEIQVQSLGQKDLLKEGMQPTSVFLPGESHELRTPASYSP